MSILRFLQWPLAACLSLSLHAAGAQERSAYPLPDLPVRIIVPATSGGTTDIIARVVARHLQDSLRVPVMVDNRAGGGGIIGAQALLVAKPDGHTILFVPSAFGVRSAIDRSVRFDAARDFAGIGLLAKAPSFLVVSATLGAKSTQQLVDLGKSRPEGLSFGSAGIGSTAHLHGALFARMAGFEAQHVPYRGTPEAINDVIGGRLAYAFAPAPNVLSLAKSGQLLVLGSTAPSGRQFVPEVQMLPQAGVAGYDGEDWFAALAPAKTPPAVLRRLSTELAKILAMPDVRDTLVRSGAEPASSTPEEMDALLKAYIAKTRKLAESMNVTME